MFLDTDAMAIKYECFYCKEVFRASAAIDGYDRGYRVGFLCPACGKNIQAGLRAKQKISREQYQWTFVAFLLFLPIIFTFDSEIQYRILETEIKLNALLFTLWWIFLIILALLKPSLLFATTYLTEPVEKS